jgi:hypothetical protein
LSAATGVFNLDQVNHDLVRSGISYWRRLKASRAFPAQRQFAPREIAGLLRNVVLVRVIDGGEDYEFLIFGNAHVQAMDGNMQGCQLRDVARVWPSMAADLLKMYGRVVQTRQPYAVRAVRSDCPGLNPIASEHVLLPLGPDDSTVDHILVFSVYVPKNLPHERAS